METERLWSVTVNILGYPVTVNNIIADDIDDAADRAWEEVYWQVTNNMHTVSVVETGEFDEG
jgi:hypothetical protein